MELVNQHTKSIMEGCKERARNAGLSFEDETLEFIVTNRDLIELSPKMMIPTLYDYWVHDVEVLREKGKYELYPGNPYETVINTRPAISFYNDNNPDWLNVMIFYHVIAHIDFFQNNLYFQNTWNDDFTGIALSDKRLIANLRSEKGRWVDYVIEFARGIDNLVGYYNDLSRAKQPSVKTSNRLDFYFDVFLQSINKVATSEYIKEIERYNILNKSDNNTSEDSFFLEITRKYPEFEALFVKNCDNKTKKKIDIIQFLIENSVFLQKDKNKWVKSVLQVVRKTSMFFQPQIRTKIMNEGWACVSGNTLVVTEDGYTKAEYAVEYDSRILGKYQKLTSIGDRHTTEKVPTRIIRTRCGLKLEGALDHRVLTDNNRDVFLKDLSVGEKVQIDVGADIWPNEYININPDPSLKRLKYSRSKKVIIPTIIDEYIGYLFGALIAEGGIYGRGIQFTNSYDEFLNRIDLIFKDKFNVHTNIRKKHTSVKDLYVYSTAVIEFFIQAGFSKAKSGKKHIPWSILQSPRSVVMSFIAGYFDGDGYVYYNGKNVRSIIFTSKSEQLINEISTLLLNIGIVGSYSINKKCDYDDCYQLRIGKGSCIKIFHSNIPIKDNRKIELLSDAVSSIKWSSDPISYTEIIRIEDGECVTFDFNVPDGNYYISNGIISHNSYWHETLFLQDERISGHEVEFARVNSGVTSMPRVGLNPYALGMRLFYYIEELADKGKYSIEFQKTTDANIRKQFDKKTGLGKDFIFKIRKDLCDFMFINTFIDQDFVDKNKLFVAGKKINVLKLVWEYYVKTRDAKAYKKMVIDRLYHPPYIEIDHKKSVNGSLYLVHNFEGKPLVDEFISNTMMGIEYLWGAPVMLETSEVESIVQQENSSIYQLEQPKETDIKWRRVLYTMKEKKLNKEFV